MEDNSIRKVILNWIKKYYLLITVIILVIGIVVDYFFNNDTQIYKSASIIASLCYNFSASLFILMSLEIAFDDVNRQHDAKQSEINSQKEEEQRKVYQKQMETLLLEGREDVFKSVFNRIIPEELVAIFSKDIIQQNVVRKNALWDYYIFENQNNGYSIRKTIEYELHNTTTTEIEETIQLSSHTTSINTTRFCYFKTEIDGIKVDELEESQIVNTNTDNCKIEIKNKNDVEITMKVSVKPGRPLKVIHRVLTEYYNKKITDTHFTMRSVVGLNIHFEKPKNCKVMIIPSFSETPCFTTIDNTSIRTTKSISGLLKGQSMSYLIEEEQGLNQDNTTDIVSGPNEDTTKEDIVQ